jgi:adenylyl-sulfate kinase
MDVHETKYIAKHVKCIWFTGLSGAGKTTLAKALKNKFDEIFIPAIFIDGDIVRKGMNNNLGFSDADRVENLRRVAEMVKIILDSGIMVICAFISPTRGVREMVKNIIGEDDFLEVFVDTSLQICMERDPKGLYKRALQGEIKNFTGLDSPYEPPTNPGLIVTTDNIGIEESILSILGLIEIKADDLINR